ncbi:hypothetical protein BCR42DRAFT_427415 [Absidia repens]|uniref:Uncharacterized protein n=1 Tax=Absidia repens TaxID=90262 RepID=A0A1X2HZD5_9FUNG|nr:hypothetical protein BCR42DRAFT_427415 [Absidia repens]
MMDKSISTRALFFFGLPISLPVCSSLSTISKDTSFPIPTTTTLFALLYFVLIY